MVPQKASGGGGSGVVGGGGGGGRIPHFNWSIYRGGNFFFLFRSWGKIGQKIGWEWSRRSEIFGCVSFLGWLPLHPSSNFYSRSKLKIFIFKALEAFKGP